jgi:hypothetical protein
MFAMAPFIIVIVAHLLGNDVMPVPLFLYGDNHFYGLRRESVQLGVVRSFIDWRRGVTSLKELSHARDND